MGQKPHRAKPVKLFLKQPYLLFLYIGWVNTSVMNVILINLEMSKDVIPLYMYYVLEIGFLMTFMTKQEVRSFLELETTCLDQKSRSINVPLIPGFKDPRPP